MYSACDRPIAEIRRYGASEIAVVHLKVPHRTLNSIGIVPLSLFELTPKFSNFGQSAKVAGSPPVKTLPATLRCVKFSHALPKKLGIGPVR